MDRCDPPRDTDRPPKAAGTCPPCLHGGSTLLSELPEDDPITTDPRVGRKLEVFALAKKLGNVSNVCEIMGISRATYYRWLKRLHEDGPAALRPQDPRRPHPRRRIPEKDRQLIRRYTAEHPDLSREAVARVVRCQGSDITVAGVRGVWERRHLGKRRQRKAAAGSGRRSDKM